jgi:hypothetical protein
MSTSYDRMPTLEERVRTASLIVIGRVQSVRSLRRTHIGEVEEDQAVAHVEADHVLRGTLAARELSVRFVRSRGDFSRPDAATFADGERLLLMLVPDVGHDAAAGTYVPYLGGAFALSADDSFVMQLDSSATRRRRVRHTMSAVRDFVKRVGAEETSSARAWEKLEPYLVKRPALSPITELPDAGHGAGPAPSEPIAAALPPRSNRKPSRTRRK